MKWIKPLLLLLLALSVFTVNSTYAASRNLAVPTGNAQQQKRVALVIGNSAYQGASKLKNPVNDAKAMSDALNGLGFQVIEVTDASQKEMNRAITAFGEKLNSDTAALFFYAGHGLQVRGKNYLVPIDAKINSESGVSSETVNVDTVLEQLNVSSLSIVILDACRNNPFERSFRKMGGGGLAQMDAPKGSFIAYATAPGKTASDGDGKNGLFTQELLKQINTPGASLETVFKRVRANVSKATGDAQMPWDSSSMTGDFYFKPGTGTQVASLEPVPVVPNESFSLDDIKKQQENRAQWNKWQKGMKKAFDEAATFSGAPDLQAMAWGRFLANYAQDNPFSAEDKQLRADAQARKQEAEAESQRQEIKNLKKADIVGPTPHAATVNNNTKSAALVNGVSIPQARIDLRVKAAAEKGQPDTPELRKAIREDMINMELIAQEAIKLRLGQEINFDEKLFDNEVGQQSVLAHQSVLARAFFQNYNKNHPISENQLKHEYDKWKSNMSDKEFEAHHILVETEAEAKAIVAQLDRNSVFEKLAEKKSKDTGSATHGGSLGWNVPSIFVKPFADALVRLKKGEYTKEPVQSQFGWHVIRLDDVRDLKAPSFEEVKPQVQQGLQNQLIEKAIIDLRASAKIE